MTRTYTNYRWEKVNPRKGDRYHYKRIVSWNSQYSKPEEQVIVTVTYDANSKSPHWGKWHVNFGAQSPELYRLRTSDVPKFSNKEDAMAWAQAMIALEGLS